VAIPYEQHNMTFRLTHTHTFLRNRSRVVFLQKMRRIPNLYVSCILRGTMSALPDIVYDCHHQVVYVSCIVACAWHSKLTGIERFMSIALETSVAFFNNHLICSPILLCSSLPKWREQQAGHVARMGQMRNVHIVLIKKKTEGERPLGRTRNRWGG
jgi:hypothetical protein